MLPEVRSSCPFATLLEPFNVPLPGSLASLDIEASEEVVLIQEAIYGHSFLGIALEAHLDEIKKFGRPSAILDLRHVHIDDVVGKLPPISDSREGWHARSQLMSETTEGPDIDLLGVTNSTCDLRRYPVWSAFFRLAPVLLLGKETGETQVSDLDIAVLAEQDVV